MDILKVKKKAKKNGKEENQMQIILNLHKMNMKIEDIAKAVELSKEEVEKIIKENM